MCVKTVEILNTRPRVDFCRDLGIAFGSKKRMQGKLVAEPYHRTQGPEETMHDYIECMLAIVEKIDEPWFLENP